jgi:hypothetical protein
VLGGDAPHRMQEARLRRDEALEGFDDPRSGFLATIRAMYALCS